MASTTSEPGDQRSDASSLQCLLAQQADETQGAAAHRHALALQVAHNLRYQHNWQHLRIHHSSPQNHEALLTPLLSGLPPERLYVHPDEQIELLQKQKNEGGSGMPPLQPEKEWILPAPLQERWTLQRFGAVFDAIQAVPPSNEGNQIDFAAQRIAASTGGDDEHAVMNPWRRTKRLLLAAVDDDSTVVYYIVHDGIVKPRQN